MKTVLFLCTGNYYRSRFAEHLFNALAKERGLKWRAKSRGLALEQGQWNVGPISRHAVLGLAQRGLDVSPDERFPQVVTDQDFTQAARIIALDDEEHAPIMGERFPQWAKKVEYWEVKDLLYALPDLALGQIEEKVHYLLDELEHLC